mgnify:CR=1 FL=1
MLIQPSKHLNSSFIRLEITKVLSTMSLSRAANDTVKILSQIDLAVLGPVLF